MANISELNIKQDKISIIASGNSVIPLIENKEIEYIKEKSFVITINYAPAVIRGHMNIHCDKKVSDYLYNDIYSKEKKDILFLSRENAFCAKPTGIIKFKRLIDYWFNERGGKLKGNYTIVWLLQLMEQHFASKKIYIFGMDMYADGQDQAKWYDKYITFDRQKRGKNYPVQKKLNQCGEQITKFINNKKMFINCNPKSGYNGFQKIDDWKKEL